MKFFVESLKTMLAARWRGWLLVLLAPLLILCARRALPAADTAAPVQVGVVLPAQGGQAFWARLEARGGGAADFCLAEEEEARRQVASGRWDCALRQLAAWPMGYPVPLSTWACLALSAAGMAAAGFALYRKRVDREGTAP